MSEKLEKARLHVEYAVKLIKAQIEAQDIKGIFPPANFVLFAGENLIGPEHGDSEEESSLAKIAAETFKAFHFPGDNYENDEWRALLKIAKDGKDLIVIDEAGRLYRVHEHDESARKLQPLDVYDYLKFGQGAILSEERINQLRELTQKAKEWCGIA